MIGYGHINEIKLDQLMWSEITYSHPVTNWERSEDLYDVAHDWLTKLLLLRFATGTDKAPTPDQIRAFTEYLVSKQRKDTEPDMKVGSWAITTEVRMESDARVDFVYFPTYIAVACLSLVKVDYPEIAKTIEGFERALRTGLRFASYRQLSGHGYDSVHEMLVAIEYLSFGKVFKMMLDNPKQSNPFYFAMRDAESKILQNLAREEKSWSSIDDDMGQKGIILLHGDDLAFDNLVC